jgi:hypothetical protein
MVQVGDCLRLTLEPFSETRAGCLDGDFSADPRDLRTVHLAIPSRLGQAH